MTPFELWQAERAAYDARSGVAAVLMPAVKSPAMPSADDLAWVRTILAQRRKYLMAWAERAGLDPYGAMLGDVLEGHLAAVTRAMAAYG